MSIAPAPTLPDHTPAPHRFTTRDLPAEQRVALWEEHNEDELIALRCRTLDGSPLEATLLDVQLGQVQLARVSGTPHVVERTEEMTRRAPSDAISCYLTLVGEAFFYHDDAVRMLRPGQLIVCDADRPFMRGFSQGLEELVIKTPRDLFHQITGLGRIEAPVVVDFDQHLQARTLAQLVGRAVRETDPRPVDEAVVLQLLSGLLTGRTCDLAAVHFATATAFIDDRLADSGLTAARIADGVGISERHLSRVFATNGTSVPQYVLSRRLENAQALLHRAPEASIAEVAARCGFGSTTYFSHAFRERFGERATDLRRRIRTARAG